MNCYVFTKCGRRKRELMRFLLLQTSLVRAGVKPAEVFTVNHCYCGSSSSESTDEFCVHQEEVLRRLGLPYRVLRHRENGSLVLFYDSAHLQETLSAPAVRKYLSRNGYSDCVSLESHLERLAERFQKGGFPHEIGIFLGYPLKDVIGFVSVWSRATYQGSWRVYGKTEPSLILMNRFRQAKQMAETIISQNDDWETCAQKISQIKFLI